MAQPSPLIYRFDLPDAPRDLAATIGTWPQPALLESGPGFGEAGRWSILAAWPIGVFEATGFRWRCAIEGEEERRGEGPTLPALAAAIARSGIDVTGAAPSPHEPPFRGGWIGYFGYDLAPQLERLPCRTLRASRLPDVRFALYDTAVVVDHTLGTASFVAADLRGEGEEAVALRVRQWRELLQQGPTRSIQESKVLSLLSNFSKETYLRSVSRAIEYIRAGDIFQVNLSQRFTAQGRIDPLDLYLRLKTNSPAPFSAFLQWDDLAAVSASPEWFYQTRGRRIVTRPIKGTRPRGHNPADDERLASELRTSEKDRAELTMIVDLERNDLGRVCEYGSVKVTEPLTVESFAQVHHLVATVEGTLRPDVGPMDVVQAVFPGGSITGAPKIRAMQIIHKLEPIRRGLYTGAIGYYSQGASAFNIAIRTMTVEGNRAHYHVGGGIVADSVPEAEYDETLHKGRGMREVLGPALEIAP